MKLIEDFNEIPSLEFLTSTQFIITIWNRADIVRSITQTLNNDEDDDDDDVFQLWEIDTQVQEIVRGIANFPTILKYDLKHIIAPVGNHIKAMRKFANFSPYLESFRREFPVDHWTHYGTVDVKRLDKILVQDRRRDLCFRYHLACNDCFEEDITELFHLLTDAEIQRYIQMDYNRDIQVYWTRRIAETVPLDLNLPIPPYDLEYSFQDRAAFKLTLRNGNKSGIEYFMNKLENQECLDVIQGNLNILAEQFETMDVFPLRYDEHDSDALYFLLSSLSDHRSFIESTYYVNILHKFLRYPFFGLFNTCRHKWIQRLDYNDVILLLSSIANLKAWPTHFFGYELFDDFWRILDADVRTDIEGRFHLDGALEDIALFQAIGEANRNLMQS